MAMSVQTNMGAISALKNMNTNSLSMNKSLERLSSGFRINSAADDAAGYAISAKLTGEKGKLEAATQNALQATAMVKTADAGINEIENMVRRLQVLATQAASANNSGDIAKLDNERATLITAIDNIAGSTKYNGVNLLNGVDSTLSTTAVAATTNVLSNATNTGFASVTSTSGIYENASFAITTTAGAAASTGSLSVDVAGVSTQVSAVALNSTSSASAAAVGDIYFDNVAGVITAYAGTDATAAYLGVLDLSAATAGETNSMTLANGVILDFTNSATVSDTTGLASGVTGASAATLGTVTSVKSTVDLLDDQGATIVAAGSELLAATTTRVDAGSLTLTLNANTGGTAGTITLTDGAAGAAQKAGVSNVTTTGATAGSSTDYASSLSFQVGAANSSNDQVTVDFGNKFTTAGLAITGDISSAANAQTYMTTLDTALDTLTTNRAALGSTVNQIAYVSANLATNIEQMSSAISTIKDADMAAEMSEFTKSQVMVQAGTAMLAQANQSASNVLSLFR